MDFQARLGSLHDVQADWLIVPAWEEEPLQAHVLELDERLGGALTRLWQARDLSGKLGELTPLLDVRQTGARRVLAVGLGRRTAADASSLRHAAATAARTVTGKQVGRLAMALPEPPANLGWDQVTVAVGVGLAQGSEGPGLRKSKPTRFAPGLILLVGPPTAVAGEVEAGTLRAQVEARAVSLARELVNAAPCDLYPASFADRARQVADVAGLDCQVLGESEIEAERMAALLAVSRGSVRAPRVVVLRARRGKGRTLGLVGKGVTFDSGGLSLKSTEHMVDMKCDMAGAAAVLAACQAVAVENVPVNLVGVLPLVENLPGGRAMKLGDVLRARNGKSIEVLNTDAEGRLILADALAYAVDLRVDHLVDVATLTGACMVALGTEVAGLMTNDEDWAARVQVAAGRAGEKVWPLPMFPLYAEQIKSHVADMRNTGGSRYAGAITAAKFLEEFVGQTPWVHLDIAGPAWAEHEGPARDPGGTGAMVRTLVELARDYAASVA